MLRRGLLKEGRGGSHVEGTSCNGWPNVCLTELNAIARLASLVFGGMSATQKHPFMEDTLNNTYS